MERKKSNSIVQTKVCKKLEGHLNYDHPEGPQEVDKGVYIGSVVPTTEHEFLKSLGITHILSAAAECPPKHKEHFVYCHLMISDHPAVDILRLLPTAIEFINEALNSGGKIFIHCFGGISRSASVTIGFLMATQNLNYKNALHKLQKIRSVVHPNQGFARQLEQFEELGYQITDPLSTKLLYDTIKFYRISPEPVLAKNMSFSCVRCKEHLFNGTSIILHNTDKNEKKGYCGSYFLSEIPWTKDEESFVNDGDINCPKCKASIGKFSWSGSSCSCGQFIVPSFSICKADVEVIKPH